MGLIERGSRPRHPSSVDAASTSRLMHGLLDPQGMDSQNRSTAKLAADIAQRANIHLRLDDALANSNKAAGAWAALKAQVTAGGAVDVGEVERVAGAFLDALDMLAQVVEENQK